MVSETRRRIPGARRILNVAVVVDALPAFTPEERRRVWAACAALGVEDSGRRHAAEDDVFDVLHSFLRARGQSCPPIGTAKRTRSWRQFKAGAAAVEEWMCDHVKARVPLKKRRALDIAFRVTARALEKQEIPVTFGTMSQALDRTPALVDVQFPGYREAGLLPVLLGEFDLFGKR